MILVVSKVFEATLKSQILEHFEANNLCCFGQFGFRPKRSTIQALLYLINKIIEGTESRVYVTLLRNLTVYLAISLYLK